MGIMGLWFLDFLLEHLSLFGKGTPQRQVPFGSTGGGVHACVRVRVCEMKQPLRRQWSHRQMGWVTDNTCCKIPSHLAWSVFTDLSCNALQTVAHTNGLLLARHLTHFHSCNSLHSPPPFFSYPKYLPSFVLCLNDASDHEVKAERSSVTKYGLFPIGSNCTSFSSFKCRAPLLSFLIPQRWELFLVTLFFSGKRLLSMMNENAIKCLFSFLHLLNSIASF